MSSDASVLASLFPVYCLDILILFHLIDSTRSLAGDRKSNEALIPIILFVSLQAPEWGPIVLDTVFTQNKRQFPT